MGLLEKIYDRSPIFIQNLMVTISGYKRNKTRYGKTYHQYRDFLNSFDNLSKEKKQYFQEKELIKFVGFANTNSEFYRNLYKDINIDEIQSIKDLKKLPVVDKELLRKNIKNVFTISSKCAVHAHTGGTTGKSLAVLMTPQDMMRRMAVLDHFKSRVGFEHLKMKRATFNGKHIISPNQRRKIFWRYNAACKQKIYSSFHLTEKNIHYYVKNLNKFKPQAIDGFFMAICDIASYIERHNVRLEFKPIAIFPTSETLRNTGRELLERVFKCKVYDQYSSSEGAPFVTECKEQKLHLELATGVIEELSYENNEILVTSFSTHGTPLIRYRIGDSMLFDKSQGICFCGNDSPIIREIQGRTLNFLYTAEGAKINGGNVANLFKNMPNSLIRAQAIQKELKVVKVLLEVDKKLYNEKYDSVLKNEFFHKFGPNTKIIIEHVEEIPREKNGKYLMIKNKIRK